MGLLKILLGAKLWRSTDALTYPGYQRQRRRVEDREARYERQEEEFNGSYWRLMVGEFRETWARRDPRWLPYLIIFICGLFLVEVLNR